VATDKEQIGRIGDDPRRPILIAGPTGAGKSALALKIARDRGGVIVNADSLQVYSGWRILTARPTPEEEAMLPHYLYGHVPYQEDYSVGQWLRDLQCVLARERARPIIVGGTGLYFSALTEGLAEIPPIPQDIREQARKQMAKDGISALLRDLDAQSRMRIDTHNPVRIQRAWEVLKATGKGLAQWQDETPPPLMPLADCDTLLIEADRDWLNQRIERRFDRMLETGALEEARAMLADWDARRLSSRAIGAAELIAHLQGDLSLEDAIKRSKTLSRRYAKRQRTWFRARMSGWNRLILP